MKRLHPLPCSAVLLIVLAAVSGLSCRTPSVLTPHVEQVRILASDDGYRLTVDGREFFVMGVNWDYFPIGTNYAFSLWAQPDDIIIEALDREMTLLQAMGVNAIRQYVGIPPRWVAHIHDKYGIYTVLNHPLGRYGVSMDGQWIAQTDYSDPRTRDIIINEVLDMVEAFQDTPGILMWLLGNENNYGLVWDSAETENLPEVERDLARATPLYSLFGETARCIKAVDTKRPVAMANGDLGYLDLIAQHASDIDVFGMNVYRGMGFTDAWERLKYEFDRPVMLTEFGSDAWNARTQSEDQRSQAVYLKSQWEEVYRHAAGQEGTGSSIGGLTFQWSDGWWKYDQETRLDEHDTHASWFNGGYAFDYEEGKNNMNEEWFGVVAKGATDSRMQLDLIPRAAWFTLQQIHRVNPLTASRDELRAHFAGIDPDRDVESAAQAE
ncbi:MAG: hypothetical protein O2899_02955 [Bacteroidetes bacterium]|nr:hypothetical protein [Bacteroidota bacterium]